MNKISKGEQEITKLLRRGGINFQREVSFEDLQGKKKTLLRFDFGIYKKNKLICLIEFDGIQHYQFTSYFHKSYSDFLKSKERDRRKNGYCLAHNIPLIRIPYWDLEGLTLQKMLLNPLYRVQSKYHNDELIQQR